MTKKLKLKLPTRKVNIRGTEVEYRPLPREAEFLDLYQTVEYCVISPEDYRDHLTFFDVQFLYCLLWCESKSLGRVYQDTPDVKTDPRLRYTIPYSVKTPADLLQNVEYAFNTRDGGTKTFSELNARQKYLVAEVIRQQAPKIVLVGSSGPIIGFSEIKSLIETTTFKA